eukprot:5106352-Pleurochrysis_carterae.AAC.1
MEPTGAYAKPSCKQQPFTEMTEPCIELHAQMRSRRARHEFSAAEAAEGLGRDQERRRSLGSKWR